MTQPETLRVGLTGGIASGKSTVSDLLCQLGALVIDSDQLAREVVAPGSDGLAAIVAEFGEHLLTPVGELDRPAMGKVIFGDDERRRALESIIHPRVRARGRELEQAAAPGTLIVHDIPLLVETGQQDAFAEVIVVDVPVETQLQRMVDLRGWTEQEARSRIAAQATREQRLAAATIVIDNSGTLAELDERVRQVFAQLSGGFRVERRG